MGGTVSFISVIHSGSNPKPGEISKSDHGILFLDELPEYKRIVLETLRQPLENGFVCIARAAESAQYPARFQLIAAMNPCPCGYFGHPSKPCRCTPIQIKRYVSRISGPLLDRFDLRIHVPPVEREELARMQPGESSATIAERVQAARQRQYARTGEARVNALLDSKQIEQFARPDTDGAKLLDQAMQRFSLSARSYHRILRVARTIADLDPQQPENSPIHANHIAEALQYRGEHLFEQ